MWCNSTLFFSNWLKYHKKLFYNISEFVFAFSVCTSMCNGNAPGATVWRHSKKKKKKKKRKFFGINKCRNWSYVVCLQVSSQAADSNECPRQVSYKRKSSSSSGQHVRRHLCHCCATLTLALIIFSLNQLMNTCQLTWKWQFCHDLLTLVQVVWSRTVRSSNYSKSLRANQHFPQWLNNIKFKF